MANGIGSESMRHTPQDFYKKVDSDGSGGVSQAELKTMAMDSNGFKPPQGPPPGAGQAQSGSSLEDQVSELQKLIESLSEYVDSGSTQSSSVVSVTT